MVAADFVQKRRSMVVSQLRTSGVSEPWIIASMGALPRENFVPEHRIAAAYMDRSITLSAGRALNPPLVAGQMLLAADVASTDHVLLVGAATGYLAALLGGRAASVVAVEEDSALAAPARANLKAFSNVTLVEAPLQAGAPGKAPYTLIIIDGAIAELPEALAQQLAEGGRIVAGLSQGSVTRLAAGYKHGGHVVLRPFADCEVAALPGFAPAPEFIF